MKPLRSLVSELLLGIYAHARAQMCSQLSLTVANCTLGASRISSIIRETDEDLDQSRVRRLLLACGELGPLAQAEPLKLAFLIPLLSAFIA
jgi:hypothetical protein